MVSPITKRQRERQYFELFLKAMPDLQGGVVTQPAPPEPDVVYSLQGRHIGVELTELHARESLRREEGEKAAILRRAQGQYESAGHPFVSVSVVWSDLFAPDKRQRLARASEIACLVAANIPPLGDYLGLGTEPGGRDLDHPLIEAIWVERLVPYGPGEAVWTSEYSWWGTEADEGLIQLHLDRKRDRAAFYLTPYSERWLLLLVRGTKPSSGFEIGAAASMATYRSPFDRAFILEVLPGRVHSLRLSGLTAG